MSLDPKEPPGGDFVAYIDELLRAQAVRHAKPVVAQAVGPAPVSAGAPPKLSPAQAEAAAEALLQQPFVLGRPRVPTHGPSAASAAEHPRPALTAEQAQQLLARINTGGQAGPSLLAIVVGIGLIIGGGSMNAGPVPFFLGIAAIVWGARRLERLKKSRR